MYILYDSFNKNVISKHRSIEAAAKAKKKFFREFYKNNTSNSYLPLHLMKLIDGEIVEPSEMETDEFYRIEMTQ